MHLLSIELLSNIIGIIGVIVILIAYMLLQVKKICPYSFLYSFLNFIGSLMILFSLYYQWNFPAVIIEFVWSIISLYGMHRSLKLPNALN